MNRSPRTASALLRLIGGPNAFRASFTTTAPTMEKKLYVGNLAWSIDEKQLRSTFSKFGELTFCRISTDQATGRARGFGFVSFADDAAALTAMTEMNGFELEGRPLRINEATERPAGERNTRRDFGDRPPRRDFGDRPPRRDFGDRPPRRDRNDRGGDDF
eukprot:jgi/Hompol1/3030/HPOL_003100-RA